MNKYEIIKIANNKHKNQNIEKDMLGVFLEKNGELFDVLILNNQNWGDYARIFLKQDDFVATGGILSAKNIEKLEEFLEKKAKEATNLKEKTFKVYDQVELVVEDEKYSKYGIHKGEVGVIIEDYAVKNKVLWTFQA